MLPLVTIDTCAECGVRLSMCNCLQGRQHVFVFFWEVLTVSKSSQIAKKMLYISFSVTYADTVVFRSIFCFMSMFCMSHNILPSQDAPRNMIGSIVIGLALVLIDWVFDHFCHQHLVLVWCCGCASSVALWR